MKPVEHFNTLSTGSVEYAHCTSAEKLRPPPSMDPLVGREWWSVMSEDRVVVAERSATRVKSGSKISNTPLRPLLGLDG